MKVSPKSWYETYESKQVLFFVFVFFNFSKSTNSKDYINPKPVEKAYPQECNHIKERRVKRQRERVRSMISLFKALNPDLSEFRQPLDILGKPINSFLLKLA